MGEDRSPQQAVVRFASRLEGADERGIGGVRQAQVEELDACEQECRLCDCGCEDASRNAGCLAEESGAECGMLGDRPVEYGWGDGRVEPSMGLGHYGEVGSDRPGLGARTSERPGQS
ncbi:hypothetical protein [Kitasatospora purpeofusca]|uniref:hypothetical protein n=1 Tax=Kitasatospora purpeofusca TaxID=67352 RepID=UPI00366591C7